MRPPLFCQTNSPRKQWLLKRGSCAKRRTRRSGFRPFGLSSPVPLLGADRLAARFLVLLFRQLHRVKVLTKLKIVIVLAVACFLFRIRLFQASLHVVFLLVSAVKQNHVVLQLLQLEPHPMQLLALLGVAASRQVR
ncbi:hypothetical protein GARCT_02872 [Geobacillus sp. 12AMOR1]|nr:hypothetical protein GARCT_02872 [Geobacillus sp. 12AMOR1]